MSDDNVEVVRRALEAYNERDVPLVLEMLDPDVELLPVRAVLEGTAYRGHSGFRQFLEDMAEDWEEFHPQPDSFRDLGEDRVLVAGRFCGRGKASGMEVETPAVWLCELREGKVMRVRFYSDEQAALEALGLEH
jgi:ketosteroid isomerase-like protein